MDAASLHAQAPFGGRTAIKQRRCERSPPGWAARALKRDVAARLGKSQLKSGRRKALPAMGSGRMVDRPAWRRKAKFDGRTSLGFPWWLLPRRFTAGTIATYVTSFRVTVYSNLTNSRLVGENNLET
jgi:hypothetical protein